MSLRKSFLKVFGALALSLFVGGAWAQTAGVTITPTSLTVTEEHATDASMTYTIVLDAAPDATAGSIRINLTSTGAGQFTYTPNTALFTSANYNEAQTITVSTATDADAADEVYNINHAVVNMGGSSAEGNYAGVTAASVEVTIVDNDTATATLSAPTSGVNEGDDFPFVVTLGATPVISGSVATATASVTGAAGATIIGSPLNFLSGNWNTPQTFTVRTATDGDTDDTTMTVSIAFTGGSGYADIVVAPQVVTLTDTSMPGVTISPASLSVTVVEGETANFTVVLDTIPTGTVTFTSSSTNNAAVTVTSSPLVFGSGNWNTPQTVDLMGVEDTNADDESVNIANVFSGGGGYDAVVPPAVTATTDDNDILGVVLTPETITVSEGRSGFYTVRLGTPPSGTATVVAAISGIPSLHDLTLTPSAGTMLTFTATTWNVAQTVSVAAAVDNDIHNENIDITHAVTGYGSTTGPVLTVLADEKPIVGFQAGGGIHTEASTTLSNSEFCVRVVSGPVSARFPSLSLQLTVTGGTATAGDDYTFTPAAITLTAPNDVPCQTISYIEDAIDEADETIIVTLAVAGATTADDVTIQTPITSTNTITDDDTADVRVVQPASASIAEGTMTTYTVELRSDPEDATVTVTPASSDAMVATVAPAVLTFVSADWNVAQTVTISGVDDADAIADPAVMITHTVAGYTQGDGTAITTATAVPMTVTETDMARITVAATATAVNEGADAVYTVVLDTMPSAQVVLNPDSDRMYMSTPAGGVSFDDADFAALTFTTMNWNTAQTVRLTVDDDADAVGGTFSPGYTATAGSGDYATLQNTGTNRLVFTVTDPEDATVTESVAAISVMEGMSGAYTLVLTSSPLGGNVEITPVNPTPAVATLDTDTLTFTADDWNVAQTVSVSGVQDPDAVEDAPVTFTHTLAAAGTDYAAVAVANVVATITEDEIRELEVSLSTLSVTEGTSTATYTVALTSLPVGGDGNATVSIATSDASVATVSPAMVVFDDGSNNNIWNVPVTIAVTGVMDDDATIAGDIATLMHSISGGTDYVAGDTGSADDVDIIGVEDDKPTVRIDWSPNPLVVDEADAAAGEVATTAMYRVKLDYAPYGGNATVTPVVSVGNPDGVKNLRIMSASALTFTMANWNDWQTVVVGAADDPDAVGGIGQIAHPVMGADYNLGVGGGVDYVNNQLTGSSASSVRVMANDHDIKGITVTQPPTVEEGTTETYTVVLDTQPIGESVTVTASIPANVGVSTHSDPLQRYTSARVSGTVVFTNANWNVPQNISVYGTEDPDAVDERSNGIDTGTLPPVVITHAIVGGGVNQGYVAGDTGAADNVMVTVEDDDERGITVSGGITVIESPENANTYTVVLRSQPALADPMVTVTPALVGVPAETATISDPVIFTAQNWNVPQNVTVTVPEDDDAVDDDPVTASHTVAGSDYGFHNVVPTETVVVTIMDDDEVGIFVRGAAIPNPDPSIPAIRATPPVSTGQVALTVTEGLTRVYEVRLGAAPAAGDGVVNIVPSSGDTSVVMAPGSLDFDTTSWSRWQQITVSSVMDFDGIMDFDTTITHAVTTPSATATNVPDSYADAGNPVTAPSVVMVTLEDDPLGVTLSATTLMVDEGFSQNYTVVLDTQPGPGESVTVTPSAGTHADAEITVTGVPVFTAADWNVAQAVTVGGVMDLDAGDGSIVITHAVTSYVDTAVTGARTGTDYQSNGITAESVTVSVRDDDMPGIMVAPAALTLTEDAVDPTEGETPTDTVAPGEPRASDIYTVRLDTEPVPEAGDVTVTMTFSSNASDEEIRESLALSTERLIFNRANWNIAATVTATALSDDNGSDENISIHHTAAGADYDGVTAAVSVMIDDAQDEAALNALNAVVLPEVTYVISGVQMGAIAGRVAAVSSAGGGSVAGSGLQFNLKGQSSLAALAATQAKALADDSDMDMKSLLNGSEFSMPLSAAGDSNQAGGVGIWGGGDYRSIGGENRTNDWSGDLFSMNLGVDKRLHNDLLVGVMVSWSEADIDYEVTRDGTKQQGEYSLDLTSVLPYMNWSSSDGKLDLWAAFGGGTGDVEVTPQTQDGEDQPSSEGEITTRTVGIGGSSEVLSDGANTLRVKAEAFVTNTEFEGTGGESVLGDMEVSVNRVRLALEAERKYTTATGAQVAPSLEAGMRYDGGDGEHTGSGVEVGGGINYQNPANGVTLETHVRGLFGHSGGAEDWGIGGSARIESGAGGQGLALTLAPAYGNTKSAIQKIWNQGTPDNTTNPTTPLKARLDAKVGYGTYTAGWLITPYTKLTLAPKAQTYRLGMQWQREGRYDLNLFGTREDKEGVQHGVWLEGEVRF